MVPVLQRELKERYSLSDEIALASKTELDALADQGGGSVSWLGEDACSGSGVGLHTDTLFLCQPER